MGGATNWSQPQDLGDWMRHQEKRTLREERRPIVRKASDLLGPGIAAQAVEIADWNGEETLFNGFYYSRPGALHSPDGAEWWIGTNIAQPEGFGVQEVWDFRSGGTPTMYVRTFELSSGDVRMFGPWEAAATGGGTASVTWDSIIGKPTEFHPETYVHDQAIAAATWTIVHNLGYYPSVAVVDSAGSVVVGDISYPDVNTVTATFGGAFGGKAYLS